MNRSLLYLGTNLVFAMLVAGASPAAAISGVHPLYLLLLFPLCSTPILHMRSLNDRHALSGLFFVVYFMYFGVVDLDHLLRATPGPRDNDWLSDGEALILAGGLCTYAACLLATRIWRSGPAPQRDWPEASVTVFGCLLWLVSTVLSWHFRLYVAGDTNIEYRNASLAQAGALMDAVYILAMYLQPLAILILAYAQARYRRGWMLPMLVVVVLVQAAMGFAEDSKGDTVLALFIVIVTKTLTSGRLPRAWLLASVLSVGAAWPVMQANRFVREHYGMSRIEVASHILLTLERAIEAKVTVTTGPERASTFFERASLKGSVEMIVNGTARGIPFQHGYTLTPVALAFIPRLLWPGKPDVQPGLMMNKVFQVAPDSPDTYISPSHLGELYWNFGWPGALAGMALLGLLLGYMSVRFELANSVTLTRVMVVSVTIHQVIWGFEGAIAGGYVILLRSLLAIGLLHLLMGRRTAAPAAEQPGDASDGGNGLVQPYFPNLMR